jgi:hypothetical protein
MIQNRKLINKKREKKTEIYKVYTMYSIYDPSVALAKLRSHNLLVSHQYILVSKFTVFIGDDC